MLHFNIFTLFPELFPGPFSCSIMKDAIASELFALRAIDIKKYSVGKHNLIDDKICGGGSGMLMRPDVIEGAIEANNISKTSKIICMSAKGKPFTQKTAQELSKLDEITIISPRYEGIDQRFIEEYDVEEYCIGDYVLSNGDISSYIIIDAIARNIPGVLGDHKSLIDESFSINDTPYLVEYPQYTKPTNWHNKEVPEVLLSGNHGLIEKWKIEQSVKYTKQNRPDLYLKYINKNKDDHE